MGDAHGARVRSRISFAGRRAERAVERSFGKPAVPVARGRLGYEGETLSFTGEGTMVGAGSLSCAGPPVGWSL